MPSFAERVAERGSNFVDGCKYFDGNSNLAKNIQKSVISGKIDQKHFEQRLRLSYLMSLTYFQFSLPANYKFYDEFDKEPLVKNAEYNQLLNKRKIELIQNLKTARLIAFRSYYVLVLGRIAFSNPQLFGDSELQSNCEKLKNINEKFDRKEANDLITGYMQRAQAKPSEIKFNPNFEPQIEIMDGPEGPFFSEKTDKGVL